MFLYVISVPFLLKIGSPLGAIAVPGASKILALPGRGGGLTHARIFLVNLTFNIHSVQNNCCNLGTAQKGGGLTHARNFLVNLTFNFNLSQFWQCQDFGIRVLYPLSRVAFTHFLSRNPPVCQDWGVGGGVKPILAMPGFWKLWVQQPLPYRDFHPTQPTHPIPATYSRFSNSLNKPTLSSTNHKLCYFLTFLCLLPIVHTLCHQPALKPFHPHKLFN